MEDESIKKVIAKIEYEKGKAYLQSLEKSKSATKRFFRIAASIIVLLGLSVAMIYFNSENENDTLFAENFEPYTNIVAPISRGDVPKNMKERAFYFYESKDYEKSLEVFDSLLVMQPNEKAILNFYKANILLQQEKDIDEAITIFKRNSITNNSWQEKNLWYLAMAYLRNDDPKNALKTIEKMDQLNLQLNKDKRRILKKILLN